MGYESVMLFNPLLDDRQFLSTDVCNVLGINLKQLEHAIDPNRSIVSLRIHNEQRLQGKRRVFCGEDVLKIGTVFATNPTGFPQKFAHTLADDVARRASIKGTPLDQTPELTIISWPMANGDWARATCYDGIETKPRIPVAGIYFEVDRFIDETIAKLKAVADEQPLPDFTVPDPVADASLLSPENDFFRLWAKDDQGRDSYGRAHVRRNN